MPSRPGGAELYSVVISVINVATPVSTKIIATDTWVAPRLKDPSKVEDRFTSVARAVVRGELRKGKRLLAEYDLGKMFPDSGTLEEIYNELRKNDRSRIIWTDSALTQ